MATVVVCAEVGLQSAVLAVLGLVVLVIATAPFLFPTRYTFTDRGVSEQRLGARRERAWQTLRRVSAGPGAVLLSPYQRPSWLDRHRGMIVLCDGADRDEVVEMARRCVAHAQGGGK